MRPLGAEAERASGTRIAIEALLVGLLVLLYLWPFRLYAFDVVDEGTQLAQIERVAAGERPYLDFETGYTPGYFALGASIWRWSGLELVATRTFGVVLHAVTVAAMFAGIRAWCGGLIALSSAALYVAFLLPISLRTGAPFNIPYPGWIAAPLALAAQLAVARIAAPGGERLRVVLAAIAGVAAGAAFSVKPNAGLLALAGAALGLACGWDRERRFALWLGAALAGLAAISSAWLLKPDLLGWTSLALLVPALLAAWRAVPFEPSSRSPGLDLVVLALGFVVVLLPWLGPLALELGPATLARDVLLLDGGVVEAYLFPFPAPAPATVALAAGLAAAAWVAREGRGPLSPVALAIGFVLAAPLALQDGVRLAAENAVLWLGPLSLLIGLTHPLLTARERAVLVFAAFYQLQLFPRPDLIHVAMGGAVALLAAAVVWRNHADLWWGALRSGGHAAAGAPFAVATAVVALLVATGRAAPTLAERLTGTAVPLDIGERAPLVVLAPYAGEHVWLGWIVREVEARTEPGEPIFVFPDLAGVGFLARRPQPYRHLYFVPGRPDRDGESLTLERLREVSPELAIVCPPRVPAFRSAPVYFAKLLAFLREDREELGVIGSCRLLGAPTKAAIEPTAARTLRPRRS